MDKLYDLLILGSGPAGLAAAIYAQRAKLSSAVIEKSMMSGGQVATTYEVDNYPGLPGMNGFDMGMKFRSHADALGAVFITDEVLRIENGTSWKTVVCAQETYMTKTVLIATGATHRKLEVPGEEALVGMGVSYCATCDGAFFKNKVTAVVGGGDVALEDAIFLARMCKKVYLIHRRAELRGAKSLQEKLMSLENVEILWDTVVDEICGTERVEKLKLTRKKTGESSELPVDGVFVAVGITPNSRAFAELVETDHGYLMAGETGETSAPGIFVAGDVRTKQLRQIVTAVSDGANAITSIERYLTTIK
ncbi:MAG: thioredoxin-disulfide reductase [Hungatella sp.]